MKRTLVAAFALTLALLFASLAVVAADDDHEDEEGGDDAGEAGENEEASDDGDDDEDDDEDNEVADDDDEDDDSDDNEGSGDDDEDDEDEDDDEGDGQSLSPAIVLSLSETSVSEGSTVVASWTVSGFTLDATGMGQASVAGRGHVHILVDGVLAGMTAASSLPLGGLSIGAHAVRVQLHHNDHTALSPTVFDEASLEVRGQQSGPVPSATGADATFLFLGLGLLIAIAAAIGAVVWQRYRKRMGP